MSGGAPRPLVRMLFLAVVAVAGFVLAPAAHAGTSDNVTGWAWSGSIGWISMNCTNDASCGTSNYGVTIVDKPGFGDRGDLRGWAWSETVGWICFGDTCTGTTPEGGAPYAEYRRNFNGKDDQFWGWAQILSLGANGWIGLNCDKDVGADECGASNYFVVLNNLNGNFTLGGANDHWGWGANSEGAGVGWIDFSIVNTSWTLANLGSIRRPEGVYEPDNPGLVGTHLTTFAITFQNFSAAPNHFLECEVLLPDGSKRIINKVITSSVRNGTETLAYTVQNEPVMNAPLSPPVACTTDAQCAPSGKTFCDPVENLCKYRALWHIVACRIASTMNLTNCAADATCAPTGICDEAGGKCRDVIEESTKRRPIFTHVNDWTGTDQEHEDQFRAILCHAGFMGSYFRNPSQCDFTGDASFSLAMRRGFPIEGDCDDLIDNDGNGQIDCADRYCQGVSYRCRQHKPLSCIFSAPPAPTCPLIQACSDAGYQEGEYCYTSQPVTPGSNSRNVVDGLECEHQDQDDGYFDCDCVGGAIGTYPDCFAPGHQAGDLCCDANSEVIKQ